MAGKCLLTLLSPGGHQAEKLLDSRRAGVGFSMEPGVSPRPGIQSWAGNPFHTWLRVVKQAWEDRRRLHPSTGSAFQPQEKEGTLLQGHPTRSVGGRVTTERMPKYLLRWCKPCREISRRFQGPRSIRCRRGGNPADLSSSLCLLGTRSPGPHPGCWGSPGALVSLAG